MYSSNIASTQPIWLCLHFPTLALDIVSRDQTCSDKPVVVTEKQRVYQCNLLAWEMGVKPDQSMDTAFSLSDQVISIERQPDREISTLQHLAQWAYQFTPHVAIKMEHCLVLEVSGSLKLFKGQQNLERNILDGLEKQGYQVTIAAHHTPLGAMLLARSSTYQQNNLKHIEQAEVGFLQTDKKIIEGLQQMGIQNLGQVLGLPISGINRRFGTYFGDYLQRLTGAKPDPQKYIHPEPKFYHSITFMHDVNNLSALTFPINRLLGELEEFLTQRQFWISHFTWHLSHRAHSGRHAISVQLAAPANNLKMFLALTQLRFDQIKDIKEVDNIALSVSRFFPAGETSRDLFAGHGFNQQMTVHTNTEQQNQLLNMLHARLGDVCFGLSEENDHRPEKAWKKVEPNSKAYWSPDHVSAARQPRPDFLLPTPKALNVVDDMPCLAGKLTLIKGPERIDFGWWDQPINKPLTRDYYIARQKQGGLLWIFKYLSAERWYLHGIFS